MKIFEKLPLYLLVLFGATFFVSCSSDDENPQPVIETLDEGSELFGRGKSEIENLITASGIEDLQSLKEYLEYDVQFYTVTYKTEYLGNEIIASGLVTFPDTDDAVPMMSFQNGTNALDDNAPTNDTGTFTFLSSVASAGYIFVIPDYIGFGSSVDQISPYHQKDYTASAVIDLMKAASELAELEGYNFNGEVFLAGYSEGGYATMAAHKAMEEQQPEGLELIASAPSSGGYDVKGFQEYFFELETYDNPFFMAFVALSYQTVYGYDQPLSTLFQEPYATDIPGLFDGSKGGGEINDALTTTVADLLQPDVFENLDTDPTYSDFVDALNDNSLLDWVPQTRMMMYHGNADVTVPFKNSEETYDNLLQAGASPNTVTFTVIEGADHGSGFFPYISDVVEKFDALK